MAGMLLEEEILYLWYLKLQYTDSISETDDKVCDKNTQNHNDSCSTSIMSDARP